eukprot:CAMPEP_0168556494 /NCGR_PEP_ID=MMETSP0413-20121227/8911_1 /TAXON_ID=136452 /ORGANISM="Filamoeba nolandi, Strain NC-AS-23-1" /LENGTH=256 /DNA_ID=CAMNT_0008587441 /DNA_START=278 /DNA_END=1048 /DNA_ORIENTATION=-
MYQLFRTFLKQNLAEENILLWFDIEKFKMTRWESKQEEQKAVKRIQDKYFGDDAEMQVNLDLRDELTPAKMLAAAQREVYVLMEMDSLPKFLKSDIFKQVVQDETQIRWDSVLTILDNFISFIKVYDTEATAVVMEKKILTLALKFTVLYREGKISEQDVNEVKELIHKLSSQTIDGYEIPSVFKAEDLVKNLNEIRQFAQRVGQCLPDKTLAKLDRVAEYFMQDELVCDFFEKKKWSQLAEIATTLRLLWDAALV